MGYRLSQSKSKFFKTEIEWIGKDKLLAIKELRKPENEKQLKSLHGAIQYLSKNIENLSAQTDILRQILKRNTEWKWIEEHTKAFENGKQKSREYRIWHIITPYLAHYKNNLTVNCN